MLISLCIAERCENYSHNSESLCLLYNQEECFLALLLVYSFWRNVILKV